jgi:hypothetical protein
MKRVAVVAVLCGISLGGCASGIGSKEGALPIAGPQPALPKFEPSRFRCPTRKSIPAPPAHPTGDYAVDRDIAQTNRGDVCERKLESVGREIQADGMMFK